MGNLNKRLDDLESWKKEQKSRLWDAWTRRAAEVLTPAEYECYYDAFFSKEPPSQAAIDAGWKLDHDQKAYGIFCELHRLITGQVVDHDPDQFTA